MAFRFLWVTADTPEELEQVRAMMERWGEGEEGAALPRKRAMTNAERQKKYRERVKQLAETVTEPVTECNGNVTKSAGSVTGVTEKEEKKRSKRKEEKVNNITLPVGKVEKAAGRNEAAAGNPEEERFWHFAGRHAPMAQAFYRETGIFPVKKEYGRWINDLRDLSEAGITIPQMQHAAAYMRSRNLPVGAPGSLLKTARWLRSERSPLSGEAGQSISGQGDRWDAAAARIAAEFAQLPDVFGLLSGEGSGPQLPEGAAVEAAELP